MKIIDINGNNRDCSSVIPDFDWPGYVKAEIVDRSGIHSEWYTIDDFIKFNPSLKNLIKGAPKKKGEDLGVVTESKNNTLTDKKKIWGKDIFAGTPIWIARGRGEGQIRKVISNNKNTVVVDKIWDVLPDKTSQYLISPNAHSSKAVGNTLFVSTRSTRKMIE